MRKLVFFSIMAIGLFLIGSHILNGNASANDFQEIPDEAIRLRILAHDDSEKEQEIKNKIRNRVSKEIEELVYDLDDLDEARKKISSHTDEITKIANEILEEKGSKHNIKVEYSENVQFPHKIYDQYIYPAGEYEALLITIGEGEGANWWCVLFPPLCFVDFNHGSIVDYEEEEVEVKFFLWELVKGIIK